MTLISYRRSFIAAAIFVTACSQGDSSRLTGPSRIDGATRAGGDEGIVTGLAVGDVTTGPGTLEMFNLRMDRQTSTGTSVLRQYANPGGNYAFTLGETIELWAEYRGTTGNPRFIVNWGDGESDAIHCGPCLLKHTYRRGGRYNVIATLDDRIGTTVVRTFTLYTVSEAIACGSPASITSFASSFDGESGTTTPADESFDGATSAVFGPVAGASRVTFACPDCESDLGGHLSEGEEGDLFVEVHNPNSGAWVRIFSQHVIGGVSPEVFLFDGLVIDFANQTSVDQVRLAGTPVGSTYHDWESGTFTITTTCR